MVWLMGAALALQGVAAPVASELPVELMVMTEVSTARARPGDIVRLRVNRAVAHDGLELVPLGAPAFGEVVSVKPAGAGMMRGRLAIRLTRVVVDGRTVPLGGEFDARGRGGKGDDVARILIAPLYAPFAAGNAGKFKAGEIVIGRLSPDALARPGQIPATE